MSPMRSLRKQHSAVNVYADEPKKKHKFKRSQTFLARCLQTTHFAWLFVSNSIIRQWRIAANDKNRRQKILLHVINFYFVHAVDVSTCARDHTPMLDAYAVKWNKCTSGRCVLAGPWQCILIDWLTKRHRNTYAYSHYAIELIDTE